VKTGMGRKRAVFRRKSQGGQGHRSVRWQALSAGRNKSRLTAKAWRMAHVTMEGEFGSGTRGRP
jgi:hypothetical protein